MSATDELCRMLDERGVEWWQSANTLGCVFTRWYSPLFGDEVCAMENGEEGLVLFDHFMTPEQAIAATLGLGTWVSPTWERWHKSLRHDEVNSIGDAVEQLMYEVIEFGGDMGPNGNTYNGIDEGDVLTSGYINEWVERFKNMLEPGTCKPATYDNGDSTDHLEPGEYHEFWEPACKCSVCGSLIPLRNYCPNCGAKVVD